ncbi:MAG: hypothetical protein KDD44_00060 [Bdellovibrionales bacterium]|nr:hypothetical protein [Bdellovibrionales bacterium]
MEILNALWRKIGGLLPDVGQMDPMTVAVCALALAILSALLASVSITRSNKKTGAHDVRTLKERVQELALRVDDLSGRYSTAITNLERKTDQLQNTLAGIERGILDLHDRRLDEHSLDDADLSVLERLQVLEELVRARPGKIEVNPTAALSFEDEATASDGVEPSSTTEYTLTDFLPTWAANVEQTISAALPEHEKKPRRAVSAIESALLKVGLEKALAKRLASAAGASFNGATELGRGDILETLQRQLVQMLEPTSCTLPEAESLQHSPHVILFCGAKEASVDDTVQRVAERVRRAFPDRSILIANAIREDREDASAASWAEKRGIRLLERGVTDSPAIIASRAVHQAQDERIDLVLIECPSFDRESAGSISAVHKVARIVERELSGGTFDLYVVADLAAEDDAMGTLRALADELSVNGTCIRAFPRIKSLGQLLEIVDIARSPIVYVTEDADTQALVPFNVDSFLAVAFSERSTAGSEPIEATDSAPAAPVST